MNHWQRVAILAAVLVSLIATCVAFVVPTSCSASSSSRVMTFVSLQSKQPKKGSSLLFLSEVNTVDTTSLSSSNDEESKPEEDTAATTMAADAASTETEPDVVAEGGTSGETSEVAVALDGESAAENSDDNEDDGDGQKSFNRVRHTLFVSNIAFETTEDEIADLFSKHATVQLVSMPMRDGQPRGFAFVDVSSEEDILAAVDALDGEPMNGRELKVVRSIPKNELADNRQNRQERPNRQDRPDPQQVDNSRKLYLGNLPFDASKEEINDFFSQHCEVEDVFIPMRDGRARGFAFVTLVNEDDVERTIEETNGAQFGGRTLTVSVPLPPGEKNERRPPRALNNTRNRTKIYIGNLSFYTLPETLQEIFEEFGTVHDCYMPEDDQGGKRGFGFVTMDREDAMNAISELDGCEVDGRNIRVNEAQPKF